MHKERDVHWRQVNTLQASLPAGPTLPCREAVTLGRLQSWMGNKDSSFINQRATRCTYEPWRQMTAKELAEAKKKQPLTDRYTLRIPALL